MKDLVLVGPILVVGGTILVSTSWSGNNYHPNQTLELAFLAFLFGLLFAWHRGQQNAQERLKAIELGWNPTAAGRSASGLERSAMAVGIGTPISLLALAWMTARTTQPDLVVPIWTFATLLGMTALICATILLLRLPAHASHRGSEQSGTGTVPPKKSKADPDEFDVVGQRESNGLHYAERP